MVGPGEEAFEHLPTTDQPFENALAIARAARRLSVEDAVALLTTGTDVDGLDPDDPPFGPALGPRADGTPMLDPGESLGTADGPISTDD